MYISSFLTMSLMAIASARPSTPRDETKPKPCTPPHSTLCGSPELLDPKDFPSDRFVILDFDTEPGYFRPVIKQIPIEFSVRPHEDLKINASSVSFSKDTFKNLGPDDHVLCQVFEDKMLATKGSLSSEGEVLPWTVNKWATEPVWGVYCVKNGGFS